MSEAMNRFASPTDLDQALAAKVAGILSAAIADKGTASLVVSGGSTPKGLFRILADTSLDWSKVTVLLADERWVPTDHADSNDALVRGALLTGKASQANFLSLVSHYPDVDATLSAVEAALEHIPVFDLAILGMGTDGHTASLFPCAEELQEGLTTDRAVLMVQPQNAPHRRISLSKKRLQATTHGILHIVGDDKVDVLTEAHTSADNLKFPILNFIAPAGDFEVFWAPKA